MCITYIFFYRATRAQNFDRNQLPYTGWFQPYCAWIGLIWESLIVLCYGYTSFYPWSVSTFFSYYAMLLLAPLTFLGWKLVKKTKFVSPEKADLVWERPIVDAYEADFANKPVGFWTEMAQMVGLKKEEGREVRRSSVAPYHNK